MIGSRCFATSRSAGNGSKLFVTYTTYIVARVQGGLCLRQHGASILMCAVFLRRAQKNRTQAVAKYDAAAGYKRGFETRNNATA